MNQDAAVGFAVEKILQSLVRSSFQDPSESGCENQQREGKIQGSSVMFEQLLPLGIFSMSKMLLEHRQDFKRHYKSLQEYSTGLKTWILRCRRRKLRQSATA